MWSSLRVPGEAAINFHWIFQKQFGTELLLASYSSRNISNSALLMQINPFVKKQQQHIL